MSGQYSLTSEEIVLIRSMLADRSIDISNERIDDKEFFNEISIRVSDEEGEKWYVQVN
jgi:hypothetical protein